MGQANCIHARMINDGRYDEKFLAYTLALNNNLDKNNLNNITPFRRSDNGVPNLAAKRHSPDGARVSPTVVEEVRRMVHSKEQYPVHMSSRKELTRRRTDGHSYERRSLRHRQEEANRSTGSRVIYSSDGHYTRYPQPSPPKPYQPDQSSAIYTTSTPVRNVSFDREHSANSSIYSSPSTLTTMIKDDSRSPVKCHYKFDHSTGVYKTSTPVLRPGDESDVYGEITRRDPSGDSSNIYSSPSTLTTTIRDDSRPTPPYKTPPAYSSAVRRSPSGASFEFSPSPIHNKRPEQIGKTPCDRNIDDSARSSPKSCEKLEILDVISNHSSQESNYEEITNLNRAKEGVKEMSRTEPKSVDSSSNEAIYDRLVADLSKGVNDEIPDSSLVLSARQRASFVCSAGLSDDSLLKETLKNTIESLNITDEKNDSVNCWLQEMRLMTEPECLTALQSKVLSKAKDDVNLINVSNQNTKDMVQLVYSKAVHILEQLCAAISQLDDTEDWNCVKTSVHLILSQINKLVHDYHQAAQTKLMFSLEKVLSDACLTLTHQMSNDNPRVTIMISLLDKVQCSFRKLIVEMLAQEITNIVMILEEPGNEQVLRQAVNNVSALGIQGTEMCAIIAESGGIRGLLTVILEKRYRFLKAQAVRALASICCVPQAISELEKQGGIECLTDILCDITSNEQEKSEAAGVIAQITSPWIEYNKQIQGLTENAEDLVRSLTDLAEKTKSTEVFLLAAAALANITFMDSHACYYLKESRTATVLIHAARFTEKASSLFAKDQIVTVLANMAAVQSYRSELMDNGGIVLLLCYLQERPTVVYSKAELAACERVQQKSAIAIARLSSDQEAAESISKLQGIPRLVRLCKDEKERNCSDSVLIACLAALRKVTAKCGKDVLAELEAEELIGMKLLDNFKKYSTDKKH